MSPQRVRGPKGWLFFAVAALLAAAAVAQNTTTEANRVETSTSGETLPSASSSQAPDAGLVATAGVRAFIDPETGRLTANPTRSQLQRLAVERRATTFSRSTLGLRPFSLSRGGSGINLEGRFQTAMRVERQPDGNFRVMCAHGDGPADGHTHEGTPER